MNTDFSRTLALLRQEKGISQRHAAQGGSGIGLSIAESICHQYGGSINASWKNDEIIFTCLLN